MAPMLFTVVEQRRVKYTHLTDNDVVVAVAHDFPEVIKNIMRILPRTERVLVVNGDSALERFWQADMQKDFEPFEKKLEFIWTNKLSFEDILKRAATLPRNSAIFWHLMSVDGAGVVHEGDAGLSRLHEVANAPIFSYADTFFGNGIVGGPMHSVEEGSELAVDVALRILGGDKPIDVKVLPTRFAAPIFDWRELQRWHIDENRLPKGSQIRFRPLTFWQRYRDQVVMIAIVVVAQFLLIVGLLVERRRRLAAEMESRERLTELTHMNRRAAAGVASASLAHEINQPLAAIVSSGDAALRWLTGKTQNLFEVKSALQRIVDDGHRAADVIKSLREMYRRDPPDKVLLDVNAEISSVLSFLHYELGRKNIVVETALADDLPEILGDRIQLKQVFLNLVTNAMEAMDDVQAQKKLLRITTEADGSGEVLISIKDTGPGIEWNDVERVFEPYFTTKSQGMGMGLAICRMIVEAHGGSLTAESRAPRGMDFKVNLPVVRQG